MCCFFNHGSLEMNVLSGLWDWFSGGGSQEPSLNLQEVLTPNRHRRRLVTPLKWYFQHDWRSVFLCPECESTMEKETLSVFTELLWWTSTTWLGWLCRPGGISHRYHKRDARIIMTLSTYICIMKASVWRVEPTFSPQNVWDFTVRFYISREVVSPSSCVVLGRTTQKIPEQ